MLRRAAGATIWFGILLPAVAFAASPSPLLAVAFAASPPPLAVAFAASPPLAVTDPNVLARDEAMGLDLGAQLSSSVRGSRGDQLAKIPGYADLVATVAGDLADERRGTALLGAQFHGQTTFFDAGWLTATSSRLNLVGIVLRPDRALQRADGNGEIRLIYRLSVAGTPMPMTLALQFATTPFQGGPRLRRAGALATNLFQGGPGGNALVPPKVIQSLFTTHQLFSNIEINLQISRWSSDGTSSFTNQVHYLMRRFTPSPDATHLTPAPLENTPDVPRLSKSPALKQGLLSWILTPQNLRAADLGFAQIPSEFLATKVISVAPFGDYRQANAPVSAIISPADLQDVDFQTLPVSRSPSRLLSRLDGLTCSGCHETHAISGFHYLGATAGAPTYDRLAAPFSAYFEEIQDFRARVAAHPSASRRLAFPDARRIRQRGDLGESCGLGDAGFRSWTCAGSLVCQAVVVEATPGPVGECYPKRLAEAGLPCDRATLASGSEALLDTWRSDQVVPCRGVCATTRNGFPSGLCSGRCQDVQPGFACASVPQLGPFSTCLQAGGAFADCRKSGSIAAVMPSCKSHADCRPDYVCVAADSGAGVCAPPYFLPQLTIEHHPCATSLR